VPAARVAVAASATARASSTPMRDSVRPGYPPPAMARLPVPPPDVLVLGAGGVIGEAWMSGVLAGIEDVQGVDFRRCEHFVGTSAGSIVAAALVAGRTPRRPDEPATTPSEEPPEASLAEAARTALRVAGAYASAAVAPIASVALAATAPGGALMRAAVLSRLPRPTVELDDLRRRMDRLGARFDGRLRIAAVDRQNGRRVAFGAPRAPAASVADAVAASCAVPWLFAPVTIAGRDYVDGGMWSPTNLDLAPAGRATEVLCLAPTGGTVEARGVGSAVRAAGRSAAAVEALTLRRRGARVRVVAPDRDAAAAMGEQLMDRARAADTLRAGFAQGRRLAARG
jgi:NTE family protein